MPTSVVLGKHTSRLVGDLPRVMRPHLGGRERHGPGSEYVIIFEREKKIFKSMSKMCREGDTVSQESRTVLVFERVIERMSDEDTKERLAQAGDGGQDHFIVASDLSLKTIRIKAYENVDLDFSANHAHAVLAENKKGKTELLLTLAGRMLPTSGSCVIDGVDVTKLLGLNRIRKEAGLGFFENVNEVQRVLPVRKVVAAELGVVGKKGHGPIVDEYVERWGLAEYAHTNIDDLDRYTYDVLGIALGMAGDPKILVVDDIETDLTEHQSLKVIELLKRVAREANVTIACGSTDYNLARHFDDVACITDDARAQRDAVERKLNQKGEVA